MVVFLDTLVVVADSSAGEGIHVVGVVHPVVVIVVAGAGNHHSDLVQMVQICKVLGLPNFGNAFLFVLKFFLADDNAFGGEVLGLFFPCCDLCVELCL